MSSGISSILTEAITRVVGGEIKGPLQFRAVGGGSINAAYRITTSSHQQWFCKINDIDRFPDLFVLERQGLAVLGAKGTIRVPISFACEVIAGKQVLVLEWIEEGLRSDNFWRLFGQQLAQLHQVTGACFGSPPLLQNLAPFQSSAPTHDSVPLQNYMGALPQSNTPSPDWVEFFRQQRLEPQIRLALDKGLIGAPEVRHFEGLYKALDDIFEKEPPALLHGDLWSGNFLCDADSRPVLIDPAVYFGHRSMDLAMTTLFGGFQQGFYEAYAHYYPFPSNYRLQWEICNLYPLLIHLNLFGPDLRRGCPTSPLLDRNLRDARLYLGNILHTIQRF